MNEPSILTHAPESLLKTRRAQVEAIRSHARTLFEGGATGIQVAAAISDATEQFVVQLFLESLAALSEGQRDFLAKNMVIAAVGGTGRGELCPFSDVDLLFLVRPAARNAAADCISQAVRDYWDAGLRLGHAVRDVAGTIALARQQVDVATSLVETRLVWGDRRLFDQLIHEFQRKVIRGRLRAFIDDCVAAREAERREYGSAVKQLEPDVKRSPGGLRDFHLLRWVACGCFGVSDVESLRLYGALARDEARTLLTAHEFVKRVRVDLHFAAGRSQDILTRDEQLRIAEHRQIEGTLALLPVECFMQTYFRHTTAIADLSERFITLHRPRPLLASLVRSLATHRSERIYLVGTDAIDVVRRSRARVLSSLPGILRFYRTAARYGVPPAAEFAERIREAAPRLAVEVTPKAARIFLDILSCRGQLGAILRSMYRTGVLDLVVPPIAHARCLLQFNQYHSYTVDEHTFRTVEKLVEFDRDRSPLGEAYRAVARKHVLHLAMLLHDLGKGYDADHSLVGRALADRIADRLRMSDADRETLTFLVYKHLIMAHLAFRRDLSEPEGLLEFSREVGSVERLQMLFTLTAADIMGVGPGVWTEWKSQLLCELYDRTRVILGGQDAARDHQARLSRVKERVATLSTSGSDADLESEKQLAAAVDRLPPHYLMTTSPERIASDLRFTRERRPGQIVVEGDFEAATQTVEFRVLTHEEDVKGCFHKATGALTASQLEIVSAQIATTSDGFVIDSFRVLDRDYAGDVPRERIEDVAASVTSVLAGKCTVEELFQRHRRFGVRQSPGSLSNLPVRVVIDNSSSDSCTVIDVFSHDRRGLLYTIARQIFDLRLSVVLAKISTHLDQVVDVFYVIDPEGRKLVEPGRAKEVQSTLLATLEAFEREGQTRFTA